MVGATPVSDQGPFGVACPAPNWDTSNTPGAPAPVLDLAACRLGADTALRLARAQGLAITFAAVDPSGVPLMVQRDDNAIFISVQIAQDKAYTAASMRMPTADLGPFLADGGDFQGLHTSHDGRITAIGGGVPVFIHGVFVGAIAVSGASLAQDIELAGKALEAIGGKTA